MFFKNGLYGYYHYNFQQVPVLFQIIRQHVIFPINNSTGEVRPYSAKHVIFKSITAKPLSITFDGTDSSKFRLAFLLYKNNQLYDVRKVGLDSLNNGWFGADSFGTAYDQIIMTITNLDSTLGFSDVSSFSYSATVYNTGIKNDNEMSIDVYPNPTEGHINIKVLPQTAIRGHLQIYDPLGKQVYSKGITNTEIKVNISNFPSSTYIIKLTSGKFTAIHKFLKY
jgi:hypothetical protein